MKLNKMCKKSRGVGNLTVLLVSAFCLILGGAAFGGGTWYWAGTESGRWDNPANWRVEEGGTLVAAIDCPGVIDDGSGGIANNQPGATAVFGAVTAGARTTIDTTNLKSIYAVKVSGADAPSYQFGTSTSQGLYCESAVGGVNSSFTVEADVTTAQEIRATIGTGATGTQFPYDVRNDGAAVLKLYKHWGSASGNQEFYYYGSGPIAYQYGSSGWNLRANYLNSGEIRFPTTQNVNFKRYTFGASPAGVTKKVVIPLGGKGLLAKDGSNTERKYWVNCDLLVTGDETGVGLLNLDGKGADTFQFAVADGKTLRLEVPVTLSNASFNNLFLFGPGRTELAAANQNTGPLDLCSKAVVAVEKIGNKGCTAADSNIGTGSVIRYGRLASGTYASEGTLEYVGVGESFNRDIALTNAAVGRVRNAGSGTLTLTGTAELAPNSATGVLALDASSAPIVFSGSLAGENAKPTLQIEGASAVTLTAMPSEAVALAGGNLYFDVAGSDLVLNSLTAESGVCTVTVPDGKSLTVTTFAAESGAFVDFRVPAGSSVKLSNASAGPISGVRMNGGYTIVDANGYLVEYRTLWSDAVSGTWGDAAKWSDGVPQTNDLAEVTAAGGSAYTVDASGLTSWPDALTVGTGVDATKATVKLVDAPDVVDRAIELVRGGELAVEGGLSFLPSQSGAVNLAGVPAALTLNDGSRLTFDGGTSTVSRCDGEYLQKGGELVLTNNAAVSVGTSTLRGTGEMTLAGQSYVKFEAATKDFVLKPYMPGESLHLNVRGTSYIDVRQNRLLLGEDAGDRVTVDVDGLSDADEVFLRSSKVYFAGVGYKDGTAVVNVNSGFVRPGNFGLHIGTTYGSADSIDPGKACFPTGIVNICGGKVQTDGYGHPYGQVPCGLILGDGVFCKKYPESHCTGLLNLSGGTLYSYPGHCLIGAGCAEGRLVQTGGRFEHSGTLTASSQYPKPDGSLKYHLPMVIGLMGGEGAYVLSNGTATCAKELYVGGCPSNRLDFSASAPWYASAAVYNRAGANGLLDICGGSFKMTSTNAVVVGAEGSGTLAFEPAWRDANDTLVTGLLQADTVVLSDQTESTLRFTLGDEGTAFLNVTNKLVVSAGAKLVIDASGLTGPLANFTKLASVNEFEGEFDPENIEIKVPESAEQKGNTVAFERNGKKGIWLRRAPTGFMILFR